MDEFSSFTSIPTYVHTYSYLRLSEPSNRQQYPEMQPLAPYLRAAQSSEEGLRQLNEFFWKGIPFNKPHGVTIRHVSEERVTLSLPYEEPNFNHVETLHACALATLAEFATGLMLLVHFDPSEYRVLLQSMEIAYRFPGRRDAVADFVVDLAWLRNEIVPQVERGEGASIPLEVAVDDTGGHQLCSATLHWYVRRASRAK